MEWIVLGIGVLVIIVASSWHDISRNQRDRRWHPLREIATAGHGYFRLWERESADFARHPRDTPPCHSSSTHCSGVGHGRCPRHPADSRYCRGNLPAAAILFQKADIHGHFKQVTIDSPEPHAENIRAAFLHVNGGPIGFDRPDRQQPALPGDVGPATGTVLLPDRSRQRNRTSRHQVPASYHGNHRQEISP